VKILILGGGPGGLYSGLLLKKANPSHEITVLERNPPDATFGWGIVFSDRTLASLREADYQSYQEITDHFVIWDAIDVIYRKRAIRCGGNVFAGIGRKLLLQLLQRRCRDVGVEMKFHCEVQDIGRLPPYDLLIATDGANSIVRQTYAELFQPNLAVGKAKFVWLGAARPFDSFTYIFEENEHGLFQVHAYTFDGDTSTFIVECNEQAWRNAGLDRATETETIAYCAKVFADSLQGRPLLTNRSLWLNFITVRNKTWRHKNIVLLGDAAHTAYFGIGSGTKMAMEDAIALARAVERHSDVEAALSSYELERRPIIEALQKAADESRTYFEDTRRYLHFEPEQFAFRILTRSGRVTYDNLRIRDRGYLESVERWYGRESLTGASRTAPALVVPPPMLAPLRLAGLTLPNRTVLPVISSGLAADGMPCESHREQLLQRAQSGAGLIMTEPAAVSPEGRITPGCLGLYSDEQQKLLTAIVEEIHCSSPAKLAIPLGHAGRRGSTRPRWEGLDRPLRQGNWPLLAASPMPYSARSLSAPQRGRATPDSICCNCISRKAICWPASCRRSPIGARMITAERSKIACDIPWKCSTLSEPSGPRSGRWRWPSPRAIWQTKGRKPRKPCRLPGFSSSRAATSSPCWPVKRSSTRSRITAPDFLRPTATASATEPASPP